MTQGVQAIDALLAEHADLERQLADPELHSNRCQRAQSRPSVRATGADRRHPPQARVRPRRSGDGT